MLNALPAPRRRCRRGEYLRGRCTCAWLKRCSSPGWPVAHAFGQSWLEFEQNGSSPRPPVCMPPQVQSLAALELTSVAAILRANGDLAVSGALLRSHAACTRPRPQRPARAFSFTRRTILGRSTPLQEMRLMVPGWWAGAQRTGITAGARVCTCVYRVLYCGRRTMYTCVFSFKCGVLQCVPLNLVDINVFWNRLRCARGRADARTNEFTVSDDVTRMALWRSRIALETRYPRLCR